MFRPIVENSLKMRNGFDWKSIGFVELIVCSINSVKSHKTIDFIDMLKTFFIYFFLYCHTSVEQSSTTVDNTLSEN